MGDGHMDMVCTPGWSRSGLFAAHWEPSLGVERDTKDLHTSHHSTAHNSGTVREQHRIARAQSRFSNIATKRHIHGDGLLPHCGQLAPLQRVPWSLRLRRMISARYV